MDTGRALRDSESLHAEDSVTVVIGRNSFFVEQSNDEISRFDPILMALVVLLLVVGLGMLLSASWFRAEQLYNQPLRFVLRQALWVLAGVVLCAGAALVPLNLVRRKLCYLVSAVAVLMAMTFLPGISARYMGASRWIILWGFSFQPSELVKLVLVIHLAHLLSKREGDFPRHRFFILPPLVVAVVAAVFVLLQNDYSTAIFLLLLTVLIFFAAGVPVRYFFRFTALTVPLGLIALFSREHRVRRVVAFLNPDFDPAGSGFQVMAARRALAEGGPWGVGIGRGVRKMGGIPEVQSDFIFAVLGEEIGFFGVFLVLSAFLLFTLRGIALARRQEDWFRYLLIYGLTMSITVQVMINVAVVAGLLPATGIPLPFFSSGGSSLVVTMIMCGLIMNAAAPSAPKGPRLWEGSRV
ncbi:cell division protein FtsW [Alkalispirochaeta americana]|uniref:Probable peptidoglycan glycosyltransferase FtsW n=1 Tax=Alkalispirochaeta americana TaxID=159291 RepID=A0A1N6PK46_9SPIO|nr:putative lipid II flippase FtsW [Alkalispirochaeta americana]SIQ04720.1 cell division protein FtsW [Alkalispirochaeta americana]